MSAQKVVSKQLVEKHQTKNHIVKKTRGLYSPSSKSVKIFSENFDSWPPSGWGLYELGDPAGWTNTSRTFAIAGAAFNNDGSCDDWLGSPSISITNNSTMFSVWQYEKYSSYYNEHQIVVLNAQDPTTANILDTLYEGLGTEDTWTQITASLGSFNGQTIYIAFRYAGNDADQWTIDEMNIFISDPYDLTINAIAPNWVFFGDDVIPKVTVRNIGDSTANDFTIDVIINDGSSDVYTSTLNVTSANIASGTENSFFMPDIFVQPNAGTYTVTAYVTYTGDADNTNDTLTQNLDVVDFSYHRDTLYSYDTGDWTDPYDMDYYTVFVDPETGVLDSLKYAGISSLYCGDFYGAFDTTILVGLNYQGNIYLINGDGSAYYYNILSGYTNLVYGFTWDQTDNSVYITDGDLLYSVNITDLTVNSIGEISPTAGITGIASDSEGNMYGLGLNDTLYSIDPTTGAGTKVGYVGFDINYAQDIAFDRTTNTLYGTLFLGGGTGGLYTFDLGTGAATQIGVDFGDELSLCALFSTPIYTVTFNVADTSGAALENAQIVIGTDTLLTNSTGVASLDLKNGSYTAITSLTGYVTDTTDFTVSDSDTSFDIALVPNPSSINDIISNVKISPNPTYGNLTITADDNYTVNVIELNGRILLSKEMADNKIDINISSLDNGIYIIRLSNDNISSSYLILKK